MNAIVDPKWLKEHLEDDNLIILDASQPNNVAQISPNHPDLRVPGARHFNLDGEFSDPNSSLPHMLPTAEYFQLAARKLGINRDSLIVVYDNLGVYSAPRVWWMFKAMGHELVTLLNGGLDAWVEAGYETENITSTNYESGDFVASRKEDLVRSESDMLSNLNTTKEQVIDARSAGRFCGTSPEPRPHLRSGHMAGSKNLPFGEVLVNGKFKSKEELKSIFDDLALDKRPLTFSCGSGLTACIIYMAAEIVGYDAKAVYDGSWAEWAENNNPIVSED